MQGEMMWHLTWWSHFSLPSKQPLAAAAAAAALPDRWLKLWMWWIWKKNLKNGYKSTALISRQMLRNRVAAIQHNTPHDHVNPHTSIQLIFTHTYDPLHVVTFYTHSKLMFNIQGARMATVNHSNIQRPELHQPTNGHDQCVSISRGSRRRGELG